MDLIALINKFLQYTLCVKVTLYFESTVECQTMESDTLISDPLSAKKITSTWLQVNDKSHLVSPTLLA